MGIVREDLLYMAILIILHMLSTLSQVMRHTSGADTRFLIGAAKVKLGALSARMHSHRGCGSGLPPPAGGSGEVTPRKKT